MDYPITPYDSFDFDNILSKLTLFMKTQDEFKDYDFYGSAAQALLRVMAYNAMNYAYQNNMQFNESNLKTAQIRNNIVALSSGILGYTPQSKKAAKLFVDIQVTPPDVNSAPATLIMNKLVQFYANVDNNILLFSPLHDYTTDLIDGKYNFSNICLIQGSWNYNSYTVTTQNFVEQYPIPNLNIDISTLTVSVKESITAPVLIAYDKFIDAYQLGQNNFLYYLTQNRFGQYQIEFGDGTLSNSPNYNNIVILEYLLTDGALGNGIYTVTPSSGISGYFNIKITNSNNSPSFGGSNEESIDSIKQIAPIYAASGGRAVISSEFEALTKKFLSSVKDVKSWGGENDKNGLAGYVYVSVKPVDTDILDNTDKTNLLNYLSQYCVGSITPIIVDADFIYLNLNIRVGYNPKNTVLSTTSLETKLRTLISNYSYSKLEQFGVEFIVSDLIVNLNTSDAMVKSTAIDVQYEKRFIPTIDSNNYIILNFYKPIKPTTLKITGFSYLGSTDNGDYIIDENGVLNVYRLTLNSVYSVAKNIGSIDYHTGVVTLKSFNPHSYDTYCKVICNTSDKDESIVIENNTILEINDVSMNLYLKYN